MRRLLLATALILAAEAPAANEPALFVVVPERSVADASLRAAFEAHLLGLVSRSGLAGTDVLGEFVLMPRVAVTRQETAEAGLEQIEAVSAEVTLVVQEVRGKTVLDSFTTTLTGAGRTPPEALRGALLSLRATTPGLDRFLAGTRTRIVRFYETGCAARLEEASRAERAGRYEEALATLAAVPPAATSCYTRSSSRMRAILGARESALCERAVARGRARLALGDCPGAISAVSPFGASSCSDKVAELVANVEMQVKDRDERSWQAAWRLHEDRQRAARQAAAREDAMEVRRLETARAIAEAWARSKGIVVLER